MYRSRIARRAREAFATACKYSLGREPSSPVRAARRRRPLEQQAILLRALSRRSSPRRPPPHSIADFTNLA